MTDHTTDHYAEALEGIKTADALRSEIADGYSKPRVTGSDMTRLRGLEGELRHAFTTAKLHSNLAAVVSNTRAMRDALGAINDLRASVDRLFDALSADPTPIPYLEASGRGLAAVPDVERTYVRHTCGREDGYHDPDCWTFAPGDPDTRCVACVQDHRPVPACTHRDPITVTACQITHSGPPCGVDHEAENVRAAIRRSTRARGES